MTILEGHVAEDPSFAGELARAHLYAGMVYMIVGEVQQDFTISDKRESGPPVGPEMMYTMLDQAITHLDAAITGTSDADIKLQAMAIRARAKQSRAIWDKIKPSPNTGRSARAVRGRRIGRARRDRHGGRRHGRLELRSPLLGQHDRQRPGVRGQQP